MRFSASNAFKSVSRQFRLSHKKDRKYAAGARWVRSIRVTARSLQFHTFDRAVGVSSDPERYPQRPVRHPAKANATSP
jgi:hypothetical protein